MRAIAQAALRRLSGPSQHFRWAEFNVNGTRPYQLRRRPAARRLCRQYLEPLRERFGPVYVTSSGRTPGYNRRIGGALASSHLTTQAWRIAAADVYCAHGTSRDWYAFLDQLGAGGVGYYPDHVHVDTRRGTYRW